MKQDKHIQLIYLPVMSEGDPLAFEFCDSCMLNVVRPLPGKNTETLRDKYIVCYDSGGLQILWALRNGRIVAVGPMLKTSNRDPEVFRLGTIAQCHSHHRNHATMALTIDWPVECDDSDDIFLWKLHESCKGRDHFLREAPVLCPNVELVIALQPRHPREVSRYFRTIYTPAVETYAYPVRDFRTDPEEQLGNAFVLSFLHHQHIRRIHFLGSSAPTIIFLLAETLALDMFDRITFDSSTWNQPACSRAYKYLAPDTLTATPKGNRQSLDPEINLRTELSWLPGVFETILNDFNPPEFARVHDWLGIFNIRATDFFTAHVLDQALDQNLPAFVTNFPKYNQLGQKDVIITALDLLRDSKQHGHEYVTRHYGHLI